MMKYILHLQIHHSSIFFICYFLFASSMSGMKKIQWPIVLLLIAAALLLRRYVSQMEQSPSPSTIDSLIHNTTGWNTNNTDTDITVSDENSYEWGWEYSEFSLATLNNSLQANKRVIIIFERTWDPTSEALRDDIITRQARIPKNTIILFANFDNEATLDTRMSVDGPNTVIYLNSQGMEMRRSWNGIVSLAQIVNNIDNLY